jgi:hypothetical protein
MLTNLNSNYKQLRPVRIETLPHWQQAIISSIKSLKFAAGIDDCEWNKFNKKAVQSLRASIPYLVHETDKPGVYILVNRDYRPIGMHWFAMVDYDKYPHLHLSVTDVAIIKPHYCDYQGLVCGVNGNFFLDRRSPCISKKHASALIDRLEYIIQDLNPGVQIV